MTKEQEVISLSVRELVGFVYQRGSIDTRPGQMNRAQEGAEIHRKLQASMESSYHPEVTLKYQTYYKDYCFNIWGRADGVVYRNNMPVLVDEIKTTTKNVMFISELDYPDYFAQARLYAWIICQENKLEKIDVQLTFYQVPSGTVRQIKKTESAASLSRFAEQVFCEWTKWLELKRELTNRRNVSIVNMPFPFQKWRPGQHQIASAVFRTIEEKRTLICQAPTGIGKSMGVMVGALHALARGKGTQIFYATARTTGAGAAEKALALLKKKSDIFVRSVTLTAKDQICLQEVRQCDPIHCPYADHYFDRIKPVLYKLLKNEQNFDSQHITRIAKQNRLCPFELSIDLSHWCDVVIGDYNYLYDPVVNLQFQERFENETILLVDEAHHLIDRVRDMYSDRSISKIKLLNVRKKIRKINLFYRALTALIDELEKIRLQLINLNKSWNVEKEFPRDLYKNLQKAAVAGEVWFSKAAKSEQIVDEEIINFYLELRRILVILEYYGEATRTSFSISENQKDICIGVHCLNPKQMILKQANDSRAVIYFSATLSPLIYYKRFFGGKDMSLVDLKSPYQSDHLLLLSADISTQYKYRQQTADQVVEMLSFFLQARQGHYMIFFPSYAYMQLIYHKFSEQAEISSYSIICQKKTMSAKEKQDFLDRFHEHEKEERTLIGFAVLGSFFSEGIDLTGESLVGVAVVGVGLPMVCPENDMLKDYFSSQGQKGFDYAYLFPGFSKVLQAIGRVIRTENDYGAVLLIDDRYAQKRYQRLFPKYLNLPKSIATPHQLSKELQNFWKRKVPIS
jgi:DNA excision repair protein ERCC-2